MKGFKQAGMVAILAIGVGATGTAQAAFYVRGEGMVYDSDHNLTWLKDANFAQTSGFDADGLMDWQADVATLNRTHFLKYPEKV